MDTIGKIPQGFPPFKLPKFIYMPKLIPNIIMIGIVGYVMNTSVVRALAHRVFLKY